MFTSSHVIETSNGSATVYLKPQDSDLAETIGKGLMSGKYHIAQSGNVLEIVGKATCGKLFKRGEIDFASDEARNNYLVDYGL